MAEENTKSRWETARSVKILVSWWIDNSARFRTEIYLHTSMNIVIECLKTCLTGVPVTVHFDCKTD